MQNEKSGPPLDFTIIIGGTIKKIKIKIIQDGGPSYGEKTVTD